MGYKHFPIGVHQILWREDGKVLLLKRAATKSFLPGTWWLPGGHHDGEQTLEESAAREALEEVGVTVDLHHQRLACVSHTKVGLEALNTFCVGTKWTGEPVNNEPQDADEIGWFDIENLPSPLPEFVAQAIRAAITQDGVTYFKLEL